MRPKPKNTSAGEAQYLQLVPLLRLWILLLVLAVPFFMVCADRLEALERSGALGTVVADLLFPVMILGYAVLLVFLKQRKI